MSDTSPISRQQEEVGKPPAVRLSKYQPCRPTPPGLLLTWESPGEGAGSGENAGNAGGRDGGKKKEKNMRREKERGE